MLENPSCTRIAATSSSTSSCFMNSWRSSRCSDSLFSSAACSLMMLSFQPVSSLASRMFWPPRPMACDSFSSATAMSMLWASSSTTIELTSAGAIALMTNWAGCRRTDDVDALAGDLVRDGLHARAPHADAGADGSMRGRCCARQSWRGARVAGGAEDVDQALATSGTSSLNSSIRNSGAVRLRTAGGARLGAHVLQEALMRSWSARARGESWTRADEALGIARGPRRCRCGRRA